MEFDFKEKAVLHKALRDFIGEWFVYVINDNFLDREFALRQFNLAYNIFHKFDFGLYDESIEKMHVMINQNCKL